MNDHQQSQHSSSYPQGYGQYQYHQQPAARQSQGSTPQQSTTRTPYAPAGSYSYDQSSQAYGYQMMPQQQGQQQQQQQPQGQQPQSQQSIATGQQYAQPMYQPQPQYSSQFQTPYVASGYPMQQGAYAAPGQAPASYPFPPYGVPQSSSNQDNSPYKNQTQLSAGGSGANINMAQIRGPLQSASQPPMIDPNQMPQRPKLTTTFWEDENTVCYQVEARGISVSRREDTNFINGTKLLNVAGMTRGRRDGILKSEKVRYVVKIGAMNLKGVWIPFERALELARNEGIVDLLYPLFVKDIKELYQGPQYSGGLTAAANSNPKNIVPVTVTNSSYSTAIYPPKEKKNSASAPSNPVSSSSDSAHASTAASTAPTDASHPQQYQYGYQSYPYTQESYQYGKSYYGYAQGAPHDTMSQPAAETEKAPEQK